MTEGERGRFVLIPTSLSRLISREQGFYQAPVSRGDDLDERVGIIGVTGDSLEVDLFPSHDYLSIQGGRAFIPTDKYLHRFLGLKYPGGGEYQPPPGWPDIGKGKAKRVDIRDPSQEKLKDEAS